MSRQAIARHISSHSVFNILANLARVGINGVVLVYVARTLGPDQYGIVSLGLSIAAIAGLFCDFGLSTSAARFLAEDPQNSTKVYQSGRLLNIVFSVCFAIILFVLAGPISHLLNLDISTDYQYFRTIHRYFPLLNKGPSGFEKN
jgi:O-antigen/teichoic acid export membrane protein